jgi:hypothetical protein
LVGHRRKAFAERRLASLAINAASDARLPITRRAARN